MARPFVNAKGKRRRPGTKSLAAVLRSDDELFVDFIGKCLTWDPDKRLKPQSAMRHPWILAGRRRANPATSPSRDERGSTRLSGPAQSMRARAKTQSDSASSGKDREKGKQLLISPPTPLLARQGQAYASKVAHSRSNSRILPTSQMQSLSMMVRAIFHADEVLLTVCSRLKSTLAEVYSSPFASRTSFNVSPCIPGHASYRCLAYSHYMCV